MLMTRIRRGLACAFWVISRWHLQREEPKIKGARILIGAPHTSNFDFALMLGISWDANMRIHWLGKKELFRGPAGPIMRALGGIPVDRKRPASLVEQVVARAKANPNFQLVVTPEGTRSGSGWRSGFYRIAYEANLPVTLGYVDGATKTAGLGPTLTLSGDVPADMDVIRAFYSDKSGVHAHLRTEPRLHDEAGLSRTLANPE